MKQQLRALVRLIFMAAAVLWSSTAVAGPPPGRPDPKQMSGLGRVDPALEAGKLSVRCLLGGFDKPAPDVEVTLELTSADGALTEKKTETTDEQGRATFEGLEPFTGGVAVASANLDGEDQRSRALVISDQGGTRTMLVKGAKSAPAQAGGAQHGGQGAMPLPGKPFPLPEREKGTLVVGALDLEKAQPIKDVEVTLHVRPAEGGDGAQDLQTLKETTDEKGRVVFDGLLAPTVPEGAKIRVEAVLYDGQSPKVSETFAMGDVAQAVVLTHGRAPAPEAQAAPAMPPPGRRPVPGPRKDAKLPKGTVKVRLWGPSDEPIPDTPVAVVQKDMGGADRFFRATTDAEGVALIENVESRDNSFYQVQATYGGAPYDSNFFEMPERVGAAVDLRVFPTTSDRSKVKSAVQYDVISLEKDKAQVVQVYEVLIEGDEAFWPAGGEMRLEAAEEGQNVVVLPQATEWLEEIESAPYARLARPIPPGQVAQLSIAYIIDHDGTAGVKWPAPFPLVSAGVLVDQGLDFEAETVLERQPSPHGFSQRGNPQELIAFAPSGPGGAEIEFSITGLPTRPKWPRYTAWGVVTLVVLIVGVSIATRRRTDLRTSLMQRRAALEARLRAGDLEASERMEVAHALDRVIRKIEAMAPAPGTAPTKS